MSKKTSEKNFIKEKKILMVLAIFIIILLIMELSTKIISRTTSNIRHSFLRLIKVESREGNTLGNIANYGYIAEDNKYIYYMSPTTEDGKYIGIVKENKNNLTKDKKILIEDSWEITGINVFGDYIYFVTFADSKIDGDKVDNQIHKIKKDGSEHEIINDNDFNNDCYQIYVIDNKVYYIGKDECIWYMDLNGNHKTKLNDNKSGFIGINDKYIFYNMYEKNKTTGENKTVTYIMDRNGKNARAITGEKLYEISVVDDYIYYLTKDQYIHKVKIDGTEDKMISDVQVYNLNVTKDGIFFYNYFYENGSSDVSGIAVYHMDLNGNNLTQLERLESSTNSLSIIDDWIFYTDTNNIQGNLILLSLNGKQRYKLYTLDYSKYYYSNNNVEEDTDLIEENNEDKLDELVSGNTNIEDNVGIESDENLENIE